MQYYYGDKFPLRLLDEGEFWKRQEAEHTEVIRALVPNLESMYVEALEEWERAFSEMNAMFVRYIELVIRLGHPVNVMIQQQIASLVQCALHQSEQFILLLNDMAANSQALKNNATALVVLNHIRRESAYFIGIAQTIIYHQ